MSVSNEQRPVQRGIILLALEAQYPQALMEKALDRQVGRLFEDGAALTRELAYLRDKGLIAATTETVAGRVLTSWTITTSGIDLVEGVSRDAAIHIERGR